MDILVIGGTGQVGKELARLRWPAGVRLSMPRRVELNLADPDSIAKAIDSRPWAGVVNVAAYTAVDRAQDEVLEAWTANALAPALIAQATRRGGIPLVHVSTDYVFDGAKPSPYVEADAVAPLNVYGASKEAGEQAVRTANPQHVIVRTAWVVSAHGRNFLTTMLDIGARNPKLRVVNDQIGSPTFAGELAAALATIALRLAQDRAAPLGTYHYVNGGQTSWFDFAQAIFEEAALCGGPTPGLEPIATAEYPTLATRPANSVLATEKISADYALTPRHWRSALGGVVRAALSHRDDG